jgi:hypothetical protein
LAAAFSRWEVHDMARGLWMLALASLASAGDPLDAEWVARDVAVAKRIAAALPATKLPDFLRKLEPSSTEEDREIGFSARRLRLALYGGYTTTWVTVISWNGGVGPIEVRCHEEAEVWAEIKDRIAAEYEGRDPVLDETGLRLKIGRPAEPAGFLDERRKVLGDPLKIEPLPELLEAYLLLWSPLSDLTYGKMYGEDGAPPPGRDAMERILAHEQGAGILDDILRGPSPEGRVYAAEGLLRLEWKGRKLDERTRKDIDWARKSDVKIRVCRGCEVSWEPAATALEEMLRDG